jgi:uncharacterized protein
MSFGERLTNVSNRLYQWMRHPQAWRTERAYAAQTLDSLQGHKYCLLESFKRSGEAVPTPVWFGLADGRLYFRTEVQTAKVKRIRANPHVRVAPCTARGKPLGPTVQAWARLLDTSEQPRAEAALRSNYGFGRRVYEGLVMNLGPGGFYVEVLPGISPDEEADEDPVPSRAGYG